MKKLVFIIFAMISTTMLFSQEMTWVPSKYINNSGCEDQTSCEEQMVCYKLRYSPVHTGVLTSYTTGFIVDCDDNINALKLNESCTMSDKSEHISACETKSKILLHCSGNTGTMDVEANKSYFLHQVCFTVSSEIQELSIVEADIVGLTTSIDTEEGAVTENVTYDEFKVLNTSIFCQQGFKNLSLRGDVNDDGTATVKWIPAAETANGEYQLYRAKDGRNFELIHTEKAKLSSPSATIDYSFNDQLVDFGEYAYRVMYMDNGQRVESNVVALFYKNVNFTLSVSPNPAADLVKIYVTSPSADVDFKLLDGSGQLVAKKVITSYEEFQFDAQDIASGLYTVMIMSGDEILTEKLILIE